MACGVVFGLAVLKGLFVTQIACFVEDLMAGYQGGWPSLISLHGGGSPPRHPGSQPAPSPKTASLATAATPAAPHPANW